MYKLNRLVKKYTTLLGKREVEFIERLKGNDDIKKLYKSADIRQLKYRLLYKRKILTNDLIVLNAVLDKLQSL
jgi:hypothetical protein